MSRKIRIGVHLNPQHGDFDDYRRAAQTVEDLGADVITVWDHFFPLSGDPDGKHYECWTTLAALAQMTSRIELAPLVSAIGYRNPNLIADMARTIDQISHGRFILGLGSGWSERDYDEYGYDFGTAPSRLHDLRDALPVIEARLGKLNPPPLRKMPILIGGGGEKITLRLVAKHADIWHVNGNHEELLHKTKVLDDWCAKLKRDPASIERGVGVGVNTKLAEADAWVEAGYSLFTYRSSGPDWPLGPVADWIAWRDQKNGGR